MVPIEGYLTGVFNAHLSSLANPWEVAVEAAAKRLLHTLVFAVSDFLTWFPNEWDIADVDRVLTSIMLDGTSNSLSEVVLHSLEAIFGSSEGDQFLLRVYRLAIAHAYELLVHFGNKERYH